MIESFESLPTVSLAEVNRTARLLTRVDTKYLLDLNDTAHAAALGDMLGFLVGKGAARLSFDGGGLASRYRSIYLDTPQDHSFLGAATGAPNRFKVRLREYVDTGDAFMEVKTRLGSETVKRRVHFSDPDGQEDLLARTRRVSAFVRDEVLAAGGLENEDQVRTLRKTLEVNYSRMTLLLPDDEARVTVDTDLIASLLGERRNVAKRQTLGYRGVVVVETKTLPGRGSAVDDYLAAREIHPVRFSKYATSRALTDRWADRKRWKQTIKGYDLKKVTK